MKQQGDKRVHAAVNAEELAAEARHFQHNVPATDLTYKPALSKLYAVSP